MDLTLINKNPTMLIDYGVLRFKVPHDLVLILLCIVS